MDLVHLHKIANKCYALKIIILPKLIEVLIFLIYNSRIPSSVKIGKKTRFAYWGIGVVIHKDSSIGANCTIGQGITIGGRGKRNGVPHIGNNVFIGAGARILGPIKIGDNSIIAPNAVVIKDVQKNTAVAGIPAKVIRENILNVEDFL